MDGVQCPLSLEFQISEGRVLAGIRPLEPFQRQDGENGQEPTHSGPLAFVPETGRWSACKCIIGYEVSLNLTVDLWPTTD